MFNSREFLRCCHCIIFTCFLVVASAQTNAGNNTAQQDFHNWAITPPMGWNSWDCYGPTVVASEVKANADYMAEYLKPYGWEYVIVDIRWYVANDKAHGYNETNPDYRIDAYGRFLPSIERFPAAKDNKGFKPLADYIHSKGLKFGIHIMRGIPKIAVEQNSKIKGTDRRAKDIYSKRDLCKWLGDMYTVEATKEGAQAYYNSLFDLYASWGVDFVKVDDLSAPVYHDDEIELIRKAIDQTGRKILLSTSPGETPIANAKHIQAHANMWRTVNDFWDNWPELKDHFEVFKRWNKWRKKGAWPDGDMLPLGRIGIRAERGDPRMGQFTRPEKYTLMTLWAMFRSPMFFGGNLPDNDAFTLSLLTNKYITEILKESRQNRPYQDDQQKSIWIAAQSGTSAKYLAVFNKTENTDTIQVDLKSIFNSADWKILDIWADKILPQQSSSLSVQLKPHGARLYKLIK